MRVDYELGIVAGAIIDKFTHMMNIYRHYSKPGNYQDTEIEISKMMDGYAAIRGYYNQIVLDRNFYVNLLEKHFEKKEKDTEKFRPVAEKHNVSLDDLAEAMEKGLIKEEDLPTGRRMQAVTTLNPRIHTQGYKVRANRKTTRKLRNMNWTSQNNEAEAQFKKGLRYKHWAERWRGFNPDIEGVHIPKPIADIGFANHSNFLPKEIKGYI
ncbi:hypothetical protein HW555_004930 [Spodoptera exigua]|uniref:Uncharacterized protein n=1 Tax=Spodoptera exigua TaxID=7107 RepID=A0A835GIQ3_SPOEX|nr:hypothetical protein HW555_004930 [Spodoptera exigua]